MRQKSAFRNCNNINNCNVFNVSIWQITNPKWHVAIAEIAASAAISDNLHCENEEYEEFCEDLANDSLRSAMNTAFAVVVFAAFCAFCELELKANRLLHILLCLMVLNQPLPHHR
jgi:hypothetical protein